MAATSGSAIVWESQLFWKVSIVLRAETEMLGIVVDQRVAGRLVGDGKTYHTVLGLVHIRRVHLRGGRRGGTAAMWLSSFPTGASPP